MTKLSITQAAKLANVSRSYFYKKYINTGAISVITEDDKKLIDVAELVRVFGNRIHIESTNSEQINTLPETPDKDKLIAVLEAQLAAAKDREEWLKSQLEKATALIENKTIQKRKKLFGIF